MKNQDLDEMFLLLLTYQTRRANQIQVELSGRVDPENRVVKQLVAQPTPPQEIRVQSSLQLIPLLKLRRTT
jgi:hypothetical protein